MKPYNAARKLAGFANRMERELMRSERKMLELGTEMAKGVSSGPYSLALLAAMGHPYARRDPRPPMEPGIINVQSDRFRSDWKGHGPRRKGGGIRSTIENRVPYAKYMRGTSKMIERPVWSVVARLLRAPRRKSTREAILRAWRGR